MHLCTGTDQAQACSGGGDAGGAGNNAGGGAFLSNNGMPCIGCPPVYVNTPAEFPDGYGLMVRGEQKTFHLDVQKTGNEFAEGGAFDIRGLMFKITDEDYNESDAAEIVGQDIFSRNEVLGGNIELTIKAAGSGTTSGNDKTPRYAKLLVLSGKDQYLVEWDIYIMPE